MAIESTIALLDQADDFLLWQTLLSARQADPAAGPVRRSFVNPAIGYGWYQESKCGFLMDDQRHVPDFDLEARDAFCQATPMIRQDERERRIAIFRSRPDALEWHRTERFGALLREEARGVSLSHTDGH